MANKKFIEVYECVDGDLYIYEGDGGFYLNNEFYDESFKSREALDKHLEANGAFLKKDE